MKVTCINVLGPPESEFVVDDRYQEIYSEATEGMDAFGFAVLWPKLERCPVDRLDSDDC